LPEKREITRVIKITISVSNQESSDGSSTYVDGYKICPATNGNCIRSDCQQFIWDKDENYERAEQKAGQCVMVFGMEAVLVDD